MRHAGEGYDGSHKRRPCIWYRLDVQPDLFGPAPDKWTVSYATAGEAHEARARQRRGITRNGWKREDDDRMVVIAAVAER